MRLLAGAALACAVMPLSAPQPAFRSGVELVRIPVSVTRGDRPSEPDLLTAADFKLTEDGVVQQISLFERASGPLSLAVALDISASMADGKVAEWAASALRQVTALLLPEDELALVTFADEPLVTVPWTAAPDVHKLSLDLRVGGSTSLVDAVAEAMRLVDEATNPRPVILVISDGGENASKTSLSQLVASRRQSEALIYAFTFQAGTPISATPVTVFDRESSHLATTRPSAISQSNLGTLPRIVGDSGGVEYRMRRSGNDDLVRAFVDDLRFQYTIGYTPKKPLDGRYRRVKVEMNKRGYRVRHRGGYLALPGWD